MKIYLHKKQIEYSRERAPSLFEEHDGKLYCRLLIGDIEVVEVPTMSDSLPMEAPKGAVVWFNLRK